MSLFLDGDNNSFPIHNACEKVKTTNIHTLICSDLFNCKRSWTFLYHRTTTEILPSAVSTNCPSIRPRHRSLFSNTAPQSLPASGLPFWTVFSVGERAGFGAQGASRGTAASAARPTTGRCTNRSAFHPRPWRTLTGEFTLFWACL